MANLHNSGVGNSSMMYSQGNTLFRKRWGHIDWRKIASVDIDKVAQEMDFQALQDNIMSVAFCSVETEFLGLDPNFTKLFRLGQLIIEYLLHSQQYLSKQTSLLEQQCQQTKEEQRILQEEVDRLKEERNNTDKNLKIVQKENRKRRKMIEAYQDMMNAGATGLHPCPVCKREFISMEYLKSHLERRHPEQASRQDWKTTKKSQEELEARLLQQMMDCIHTSESQWRDEMKQKEMEAKEAHAAEMKEWKAVEQKQIMSSYEAQLEEWKAEESTKIKDALLEEFEKWKAEERKKMMLELEELKKPMLEEVEHVHKENLRLGKEKLDLEKALKKKEEDLANALGSTKRPSHVGHLEGAKEILLNEVPMEQQNGSNASMLSIKECVEKQMESMRTFMNKRDATWKKRISELYQYQQSLSETGSKPETLEMAGADTVFVSEIESLKDKQKKQEQLLKLQQDELDSLRKKKLFSAKSSTKQGSSRSESATILPIMAAQAESIDSLSTSNEDQGDFEGKLQYSPMKYRPMIKTIYQHSSADMEKIREQTRALFCEALLEKNIDENRVGLKAADLEAKMALLHHERTKRHSSFHEHRQRMCEKLEEYCSNQFTQKASTPVDQTATQKLRHVKRNVARKPPKPSKILSYQQEDGTSLGAGSLTGKMFDDSAPTVSDSSTDISFSHQQDDANSKGTTMNIKRKMREEIPAPIIVKGIETDDHSIVNSNVDEESVKHLDELTDLDGSEEEEKVENYEMAKKSKNEQKQARKSENTRENFFDAITGSGHPSTSTKLNVEPKTVVSETVDPLNNSGKEVTQRKEQDMKEDSPWDSTDDDSVKDLVALAPRIASSTPLKPRGVSQLKVSSTNANMAVPAENVSLDSFDLSSSNEPIPQKIAQSSTDKVASLSKNATSQSALTNVSLDEFDLSDLSDIM